MKTERRIKFIRERTRKIYRDGQIQADLFFRVSCEATAEMLSMNEAASRSEKGWREIVRLIENGELLSTKMSSSEIYVCAASFVPKVKEN